MKIEHLALNLADPAGAAKWYAEQFGLRIIREDTVAPFIHFVADDDNGTLLEFYNNPAGPHAELGFWTFHIAFAIDEMGPIRSQLVAAGATVESDVITLGNGDQTQFLKDPFGLHVQLIKRINPLPL